MNNLPIFEDPGIPLNGDRRKAFNELNEMVYKGSILLEEVGDCFCGGGDFKLLSRYDRFGLPFGTKICKSCGLICQTMRIHPDSLPKFYDSIYWPLISGVAGYSTAPKKDEDSSFLLNYLSFAPGKVRVFEIGCGSGVRIARLTAELRALGYLVEAYGCDYSREALNSAKETGTRVVHGGMKELSTEGVCDILVLSHVFEHFPDLTLAMEQIEKLVHDGTLIYIEVPGVLDLEHKREYLFNYQNYSVLAHTFNFSLSTLTQVMLTKGFGLVGGDEYVRAVFKKGNSIPISKSPYNQIINGMNIAHQKQLKVEGIRNLKIVKYLRRVVKALLGREL